MGAIKKSRDPVIGESVPFEIVCEKTDGTRLDLTGATIWLTLKTDPDSQADAAAAVQIETLHEPTQFGIATPATNGEFTVELSGTNTAGLTAGTIYYVDVKVKDAAGHFYYPVQKQPLQFTQWVSRATTEA